MVVLRSGKVVNTETAHRRRINTHFSIKPNWHGRVMQYRGRPTNASMRRGPDRFHEPLNLIPVPPAPASPSMPPLDPPARGIEEAFPDFPRGPLPTQTPSRHHRENDTTCDCMAHPALSLLGYTPLCIHRMIDPLSPRHAQYLPQDYTMYEGERGSDAVPLNDVPRTPERVPRIVYNSPPAAMDVPSTPEDDLDDSDLELTAWTDPSRRA
jgi:hypothetical protein